MRRDQVDVCFSEHLEHSVKVAPVNSRTIEIYFSATRPFRNILEQTLLFTPVIKNEIEVTDGGPPSPTQKVIGLADERGYALRHGLQSRINHLVSISSRAFEELDLIHADLQMGGIERYYDLSRDLVATGKGIPAFLSGLVLFL